MIGSCFEKICTSYDLFNSVRTYIYIITFQRCKALQPDLGLYFDFLEDSYKLRCISAGWGSENTAMFSSQANKIHTHASC